MYQEIESVLEKTSELLRTHQTAFLHEASKLAAGVTSSSFMLDVEYAEPFYKILPEYFIRPHSTKIVGLLPSQQIVGHQDPFGGGNRRFHIPLQLNDGCWVFHDGDWQQLQVGKIYEMDPTKVHGAVNWGTTVRLHLMIDSLS